MLLAKLHSAVAAEVVANVDADLGLAFASVADVVFGEVDVACADAACAAALAERAKSDVVWGTFAEGDGLFTLDLHLHERHRGGSVVRARLEAPELALLSKQIRDASVRMLGGEPVQPLSPWLIAGGLAGGLGIAALVVGTTGVGYCVWAANDENANETTKVTAATWFVPAVVTAGAGALVAVAGIAIVGSSIEE